MKLTPRMMQFLLRVLRTRSLNVIANFSEFFAEKGMLEGNSLPGEYPSLDPESTTPITLKEMEIVKLIGESNSLDDIWMLTNVILAEHYKEQAAEIYRFTVNKQSDKSYPDRSIWIWLKGQGLVSE